MKTKYSLMLFILLFPVFVYAQQGNTMSSPLEVGAFGSDFEYSDTKNTENFTNNYGSFHNDIFYKFILTTSKNESHNKSLWFIDFRYIHKFIECFGEMGYKCQWL